MRKLLIFLLLCGSAFAGTCGNGYSNGPITITQDHTKVGATDQTDFVSVICFNGACQTSYPLAALKTSANGGSIQHTAANTASITGPADFILCDASSAGNAIPFTIPFYNAVSGATEVWYKKTLSHTVDTSVYLFFNNSGVVTSQQDIPNTFSNNFLHAYTFGDNVTLSLNDLVGSNNFTNNFLLPSLGVTGGGLHGSGASASGTSSSNFTTATTNITFSVDFQWSGFSQITSIWINGSGTTAYALLMGTTGCSAGTTIGLYFGGITCNAFPSSFSPVAGKWYHATIKRDATTWRLLIDGVQITTTTSNPNTPINAASRVVDASQSIEVDNLTVASVMRSDDWNLAEANNRDQLSFYSSVSPVDSPSSPHIVQYNYCSFNGGGITTTAACLFQHPVTSGNLLLVGENTILPHTSDTSCSTLTQSDTLTSTWTLRQSALAPAGANTVGSCTWSASAASTGTDTATTTYLTASPSSDKFIVEVAGSGTTMRASSTDSSTSVNPFTMSSVTVPANNSFMFCRGTLSPVNGNNVNSLTVPTSLNYGSTSVGSNATGSGVGFGFVSSGSKNCTFAINGSSNAAGTTVVFGAATSATKRRPANIY